MASTNGEAMLWVVYSEYDRADGALGEAHATHELAVEAMWAALEEGTGETRESILASYDGGQAEILRGEVMIDEFDPNCPDWLDVGKQSMRVFPVAVPAGVLLDPLPREALSAAVSVLRAEIDEQHEQGNETPELAAVVTVLAVQHGRETLERCTIVNGELTCPRGHSGNIKHQDRTWNERGIEGIFDGVLVIDGASNVLDNSDSDDELYCGTCGVGYDFPEGVEIDYR